jgi:hypothetical protein
VENGIKKEKIIEHEAIEKQYFNLAGKNRARARKKYLALLHSCQKSCSLDESIYMDRI